MPRANATDNGDLTQVNTKTAGPVTGPAIYLPEPGTRIPALDGVRGVAILLVMLHHFAFHGGFRPAVSADKFIFHGMYVGWVGVDLFFVLSGFLITGILLDTKGSPYFFRNFYIRRTLRIFPLYYGFLVVFFLILPRITPLNSTYHSLINDQSWYWSYLVNLKIARAGWPPFYAIGHFWSLAVEEQFYLFWPLVVFLLRPRALMAVCLVIIVGSLGVRLGLAHAGYALAAYVLTPARMDALAVGAILALVARRVDGLVPLLRWAWPVAGVSAVVLAAMIARRGGLYPIDIAVNTAGFTLVALLFGALLTVAVTSPRESALGKVFGHPGLMFFGRYSYALYVFHHPVAFLISREGFTIGTIPTLMDSQLPGLMLYTLAAAGASLGLAVLSWHFFEAQCLKLKNLFPYHARTDPVRSRKLEANYVANT